ncbi:uncharacterized protein LOC130138979 [Syzygium oleosum]|uniref:uncharacterized protein LOC130138979 n=1 Tax=Syzygium oleosum TaxID=219896 RepID=UPI0024BAACEE|nr:uncharacterized protein LOC130138979 [Syzygium oleosum]
MASQGKKLINDPDVTHTSCRTLFSLCTLKSRLMLTCAPFRRRKRVVLVSATVVEKSKDDRIESNSGSNRKGGPVVRVPATALSWRRVAAASVKQKVAARRAMAKKQVVQNADETVVRKFSIFMTARGNGLFTQSWRPVNVEIRGLVILLHGLNEHSGRYNNFAKKLNVNGFKVYGMDWIGHGGSDGLHAYVRSLDDPVCDLKSFIGRVLAENPGLPCFCFGHSTGAAIILKAALDPKVEACISGVVLTSPAVGVQPSHPIYTILAPIVSLLLPRYQVGAANKKGLVVSRDPEALVAKYSDPLVYTGSIRVRTGYEILRIASYLQQNLRKLRVPFLVLHGTADRVTDPDASVKLHKEASATDKTIRLLEGHLHDLLFEPEPEREAIMKEIIEWLNSRVER